MYNDNIYFLLYKKLYNDNKHFLINENVFLLYETMYNNNKHFLIHESVYYHYILSCIMTIFIFHYTREYIMITNIFLINENVYRVIHENVFVVIQDDV